MPTYDYRCDKCNSKFELQLPVAQRNEPVGTEHLDCGGTIEKVDTAPGVSYTYGGAKTSDSFKDVLRRIKKSHRHSTINV